MTEYWLQKKTLGGWSHITWYSDWQQALDNYDKLRQSAGYSYRMVSVNVEREQLLEEVMEVEAPSLEPEAKAKANVWGGQKTTINGWGDFKKLVSDDKGNSGWADLPSSSASKHGLAGMVWMVNHVTKQKSRITPDLVEQFELNGWERGGPKTKFRE